MISSTCYSEVRREWQAGGMHITLCGKPLPCAEHNQRTYTQAELDAALAAERARVVAELRRRRAQGGPTSYDTDEASLAYTDALGEMIEWMEDTTAAARGTGEG